MDQDLHWTLDMRVVKLLLIIPFLAAVDDGCDDEDVNPFAYKPVHIIFEADSTGEYRPISPTTSPCGFEDDFERTLENPKDPIWVGFAAERHSNPWAGISYFTPSNQMSNSEYRCNDGGGWGQLSAETLSTNRTNVRIVYTGASDVFISVPSNGYSRACGEGRCFFGVGRLEEIILDAQVEQGQQCLITCGTETFTECEIRLQLPDQGSLNCMVDAHQPSTNAILLVDQSAPLAVASNVIFEPVESEYIFSELPAAATITYSGSEPIDWIGNCTVTADPNVAEIQMDEPGLYRCGVQAQVPTEVAIDIGIVKQGTDGAVMVRGTGNGLSFPDCQSDDTNCMGRVAVGSTIQFEAVATPDSKFMNWGTCGTRHGATGPILEIEVTEALAAQGTIACVATFGPRGCGPGVVPPVPVVRVFDDANQEVVPVNGVYDLIQTRTYTFDAGETVFDGDDGYFRWELEIDGLGPQPGADGNGQRYTFNPLEAGVAARQTGNINVTPVACNMTEGDFITLNWKAN